jgi:flagellar biosynthesis anti-sigma factor FlgM
MKVNDSNLPSPASLAASLPSSATTKSQETERVGQSAGSTKGPGSGPVSGDDVHLSELVRSLRALAADSPERQARLEQIARSYANGTYQPDTGATASKMINDALDH